MAQFQWTFDAPTGVYKSHAMSRKLWTAAVEEAKFAQFCRPIDGYGKHKGDTVTLTRIARLTEPTSAVLTEGERIAEDNFSMSTTSITVQELGRAVPYTSLIEDLSEFNLENPIQAALRQQLQLVLDTKVAGVMTGTSVKVKYAPTGLATNSIATAGTFGATASANMNTWHLEQIRDYLYDTLLTPPYEGDDYIGIFRTLAIRGIKQDPAWEEWHKYTDPSSKYNGEAGRWEHIRLIETNHSNALAKVGTSSVLGSGIVFGADFVAMAEVLTPELRAAIPSDFGRSKAVAWYGILNYGVIWDTATAGQARGLHVGSL
jgi:N4-gp56 family major capsid protein